MHQEAAEKEQQSRELIEKRMQAVKSLKSNIAANQVRIRNILIYHLLFAGLCVLLTDFVLFKILATLCL